MNVALFVGLHGSLFIQSDVEQDPADLIIIPRYMRCTSKLIRRISVCDRDHRHASRPSSSNARFGVFDDPALGGIDAQELGRAQKDVWSRLATRNVSAANGN